MTGNRAHLEDYQELSKVGSVTFGGSKGSISGKDIPSPTDQDIPSPTDQGNKFATPEKCKDLGEAQAEQISPSTLEAAQILTNVASEGFKGSQSPHGSKIYRRKPKSTTTPTKVLDFEDPAERPVNTASTAVNTGSTPSAQVNTASTAVNTGSTPLAQVNTAELNTAETERVQRREGKAPMTEE
ncbi:hypothetical protein Tco_1029221, partial [Tanacetum coccineum]